MARRELLLNKAKADLTAAENLLKHSNSSPESIAFHLQQTMEKLLKALLVKYNINYPQTHDLDLLIDLVADIIPEITSYYDLAEQLSPHAVLSRYEEGSDATLEQAHYWLQEVSAMYKKFTQSN